VHGVLGPQPGGTRVRLRGACQEAHEGLSVNRRDAGRSEMIEIRGGELSKGGEAVDETQDLETGREGFIAWSNSGETLADEGFLVKTGVTPTLLLLVM